MVDLRSLVNVVVECCEEDVENTCNPGDKLSAIQLHSSLEDKLTDLVNGIDEMERYVKSLLEDMVSLKDHLEDISESLY